MRALLVAVFLLWATSLAHAQSAIDCTGAGTGPVVLTSPLPELTFTNTDQNAVIPGSTTPVITNYAIAVCRGAVMVQQGNLGKPAQDVTTGLIMALVPSPQTLARNTAYYIVLYAIGPGGSSKALPTDPFAVAGPPAASSKPRMVP